MSLKRNGLFSAAEVVVSGVCLFLIYRNVVQSLGVSMLGVWALVLATTAFGRAADLGIAGGLARFVARSLSEGSPEKAVLYMRTGVTFMAVFIAVVIALLWWPLWWSLDIALDGHELSAGRDILPWAMLSLWLLILKTALDSCLLGLHRADLRSISGISGMIFQLIASALLIDHFELRGLAWAQTGQFALAIAMEVTFLRTIAKVRVTTPTGAWFSRPILKEMLGFGLKIQAGSLANLMFEPVVKTVLGAAAGTTVLGIFEMAYRMAYQVRNVAIMALQPTVAVFAELSVKDNASLVKLFREVCRNAAAASAVLMTGLMLTSPIVSWLYLGRVDQLFVYVSSLMGLMWAATILSAPAYYLGIASGKVTPYVLGEFLALIIAPACVFALGAAYSPRAAVVGVVAGKLAGSAIPASFTRPSGRWQDSTVANRAVLCSLAVVLLVSGSMTWFAVAQL